MRPLRVVVAGLGMAGARFAEEIRRLDPGGRKVSLTVLAAEPRPGYNRVLLPNLLSGVMTEEDLTPNGSAAPPVPALTLRTSAAVTGIDPAARTVSVGAPAGAVSAGAVSAGAVSAGAVSAGAVSARPAGPGTAGAGTAEVVGYDALVLATGARPAVPPLPGLDARDVSVLRTLTDARRIGTLAQAARRKGQRIAVLGGGVLGLEAARALAARGTAVTLVHRGGLLMERQLDAPAGRVLADAVRRTGVTLELGTGAARWEPGRGLWLADGRLVPAAGLVVCTGTVPETSLARAAGLRLTETGAVAVDDTLATSAERVYAIGDCAGHPGAAGGLVQAGWEQAAVLAARLTGTSPRARYRGSGAVTRLKAAGIELTCVGSPLPEPGDPDYEVLRFEDPARERYAKLVLAENRVAGAILIGLPDAAAGIVQLYDRDAAVPADRLALLLGRALPPPGGDGAAGPAALPDYAVVCRCNMVTKSQLRDAWYGGACGRAALSAATRAATGCGTCGDDLDAFASWLTRTDPSQAPGDCAPGDEVPGDEVPGDQVHSHQAAGGYAAGDQAADPGDGAASEFSHAAVSDLAGPVPVAAAAGDPDPQQEGALR